jgi:two-component system OmpR family response regulator
MKKVFGVSFVRVENGNFNAGFVVSRQELLSNVDSIKYESSYKSIDVLIGRVRAKTEENTKNPKYILSIRGVGYKLVNQ